jgi:antitoxin component YwqK of YwqJK toxin-antitoxin module
MPERAGLVPSDCDPSYTSPETRVVPAKRAKAKNHVHYHKDGSIWATGPMTNGVMTGYWEWFRKDGSLMRSGHLQNGEQVGEWTTYDRTGKVVKVTTMKPRAK